MNSIQQKISKTSKFISKILKVGYWILGISSSFVVVMIGILLFTNSGFVQSFIADFPIPITDGGANISVVTAIIIICIITLLFCLLAFWIVYNLYQVFNGISENHTPFELKQADRIRKIALLSLILCVGDALFETFANILLNGSLVFSINVIGVVMVIVVYCLALVFDYGYQLQQQADETL